MKKGLIVLLALLVSLSGCAQRIPKDALQLSPESLATRQIQTRTFETSDYSAMLGAAAAVYQDLGFSVDEAEIKLGVIVGSKQRDATSGGQVVGAILVAALTGAATHIDSTQVIRASLVIRELEGSANKPTARPVTLSSEKIASIKARVTQAVSEGLKTSFPQDVSKQVAEKIGTSTASTLTEELSRLLSVKTSEGKSAVRVTFQRVIFNTAGQVTKREQITDPEIYKEFYAKLSQAVFLEAHEI